jgi:hypothetical protein
MDRVNAKSVATVFHPFFFNRHSSKMHPRRVPGAASSLNAESSTRKRSSSMLFKPTSTSKKANTRRTSPVIDSNNALAPQRMTLEQTANAAASLMQFTQSLQPSQSQGTRYI